MRLYQRKSYQRTFESTVLEVFEAEQGAFWLRLEDTLFYHPTAGGQPHDTGVLGGAEVVEVKQEAGEVWHLLNVKGQLPNVSQQIAGEIDWPRRYRHMQRHSAQHLLSQAFVQLDRAFETRAVSLSGPVCTLDLAGEPQLEDGSRAEACALEAMYAGLEITSFEVDERELSRYPLRRPPKLSGRVRLVQMGDFELSACGGTHLRRTSEALPLKLLKLERIKGGLARVHFTAGWEALADYGLKHRLTTDLAGGFSAQIADLPARVKGLQDAVIQHEGRLKGLKNRLAVLLADQLIAQQGALNGPQHPHVRPLYVRHLLSEDEAELLAPLAQRLTEQGVTALLAALQGTAQGERVHLLFARPTVGNADVQGALLEALPYIEGRGGGSAARAQGSGGNTTGAEAALRAAAQHLGAASSSAAPKPYSNP